MGATVQLQQTDNPIRTLLAAELAEVDAVISSQLDSDLECVRDLLRHVERYSGKRMRPTLLLLAGMATRPDGRLLVAHRTLGAVVEMAHLATLVHDDVLDEAEVRRGGATLNALAGNEAAVMLGDTLISRSYHLCSSLDSQAAARLIAATTNTVCEGELLQLANRNNRDLDEATYFEIIRRKTAVLVGASCRLGAMVSGADPTACDALEHYGEQLGMAFQITDDLLDLTGEEDIVGKSLGKDLEKGKLTLPLIHHLASAPAEQRAALLEILDRPTPTRGREVAQLLRTSASVEYAHQTVTRLVNEAKATLACLPDTSARTTLLKMADTIITRRY